MNRHQVWVWALLGFFTCALISMTYLLPSVDRYGESIVAAAAASGVIGGFVGALGGAVVALADQPMGRNGKSVRRAMRVGGVGAIIGLVSFVSVTFMPFSPLPRFGWVSFVLAAVIGGSVAVAVSAIAAKRSRRARVAVASAALTGGDHR